MKKINDVFAFILGHVRYPMYYNKYFKWMMRGYIKEQIDWRIKLMRKSCYNQGSCIKCGCTTTQLQMANKSCDGLCYPPILSKKKWAEFCLGKVVKYNGDTWQKRRFKARNGAGVTLHKNGVLVYKKVLS